MCQQWAGLGECDGFLTMLEWDFLGISLLEYK